MTDSDKARPDEAILGGEASVPDTAGTAAGGAGEDAKVPKDKDATKPPER